MSLDSSIFCSVDDFVATPFDFVVVGGGTAGLAVAARLAENFGVGVLEAGDSKLGGPVVDVPNLFPQLQFRPGYDWMLKSVPQVSAKRLQSRIGWASAN